MATCPPKRQLQAHSSDKAYDSLQLAKMFALAYAPYIAALLSGGVALASVFVFGWDTVEIYLWGSRSNAVLAAAAASIAALFWLWRGPPCYLVDFASFKSLDKYKLTMAFNEQLVRSCGRFTGKNALFQLKVLLKSGLGDETYGPPSHFGEDPTRPTIAAACGEMDLMMFGALDELLLKTGLTPSAIDFLIVNVSMFHPAPSLASRLVNHYKMREDVKTYNISGQGCAAGMIGVDLAKDILRVHKNKYVVVVGTENMTLNLYCGNDRSMLVPNCIFRCGSYALLMSNKAQDRARAKFELVQSVRTTTASSDTAYNVIFTREDDQGLVGTALSVELLDVATKALTISMTKLVPFNMPFSEICKVLLNALQRRVFKGDVKPYLPNFKKAFDHFCLHPGGKAVIDGVGKSLNLSEYDLEPARMSLHRFGNTSSSGLWYAVAYCEAKKRLKKGNKVWQVALGSGFKCNSVVWKVLRDVKPRHGFNPWMECIDAYPVEVCDKITPSHMYYHLIKEAEEHMRLEEESLQKAEQERLAQHASL